MKELLVLGGGYGGMRLLQDVLTDKLPDDVRITLVDRQPYHGLKTEYYALAAGTTSDSKVRMAFPEHSQFSSKCGEANRIDLSGRTVYLDNGEALTYDDLVIGMGSVDSYHEIPGAKEHTHSIQTICQARKAYEALSSTGKNATVSIVGGGLSGVELAAELYESRPDLKICLFDRGKTILSSLPKRISRYVQQWFIEHDVRIINEANITKVEPNIVYNHNEPVESDEIVWTAGIRPNGLINELDVEKDNRGRVVLTDHHEIPGHDGVFVVGDCASLPHAPSAQLAELQADQIAEVLKKKWKNEPLPNLSSIKLKGTFGSLGKKEGFGLMAGTTLTGRVPRLLKSGILWMYKFQNG
ncbi:MAG TPA: NAD(P)/FAD-dependent oxidoreductase [Bacillales bacterium]|nr:NAD(P)/FAD-dependent oxidoreductase [Bacillales bacterium]